MPVGVAAGVAIAGATTSAYSGYEQGQAADQQFQEQQARDAEAKRQFDASQALVREQAATAKAAKDALIARQQQWVSRGQDAFGRLSHALGLPETSLSTTPQTGATGQAPAPPSPPPNTQQSWQPAPVSPPMGAPPVSQDPMQAASLVGPSTASPTGVKFQAPDGSVRTLTVPADIYKAQTMGLRRVS